MKALAISILALAAAIGVLAQVQKTIQGSGRKATRVVSVGRGKNVPNFKKVELRGSFDLDVKGGPQSDLKITGDDNLVKLVSLKVVGDTLYVDCKENYSTKMGLKVAFSSSSLTGVGISGSGDAHLSGFRADRAEFSISGSGDIKVTGQANSVKSSVSGSGNIDLSQLRTQNATVSIAGSGDIKLNVTSSLAASIAGSGDVLYKGKPKVSKNIAGSGEVRPY